jgi:hypothetical protein
MKPHHKKVALLAGISFGMIMLAYFIPIIATLILGLFKASDCTDPSCASGRFNTCGGFGTEDSSDLWTRGFNGLRCWLGADRGASAIAYRVDTILHADVRMSSD